MFGIFRTALAIAVVFDHFGDRRGIGPVAVFSFFCLSGFLMTLLMAGPYSGHPLGFLANRFLRLYPLYWVAVAMKLALLAYTGAEVFENPALAFYQFLYIATPSDSIRWIPTAWAVTNEIVFYIAIALGLSKTLQRTLVWLGLSAAYVVAMFAFGGSAAIDLYGSPLAASFPFALGAAAYHIDRRWGDWLWQHRRAHIILAGAATTLLVIAMVQCYAALHNELDPDSQLSALLRGLYSALAPSTLLVVLLHRVHPPEWLRWSDEMIGRLSYPIYLVHMLVAEMIARFVGVNAWNVLFWTMCLTPLLVVAIDLPVQRMRTRLRDRIAVVPLSVSA
jgi:peptidoglycan/LPS O-acetylase OafA/YrhL